MAIQTKHQVLSDANSLQQRLLEAQNTIQQLDSSQQLEKASTLINESALLTQLQNKVNATYLVQQGAIPEVNDDELGAIAEKVCAASDILENIQANYEAAAEICELALEVQSVFERVNSQNIPPHHFQLANQRLRELASSDRINIGNLHAIQRLQATIQSYQQPPHQAHAIQAPNRNLIAEQNESFEVAQFRDRFTALLASFKQVPTDDFNSALEFYIALRTAYPNKKQFFLPENKAESENLLKEVEKSLDLIIEAQKRMESVAEQGNVAPAVQGLRISTTPAANPSSFQQCKVAVDHACNQLAAPNPDKNTILKQLQEVLSKISVDQKEKLFAAVNDILVKEQQKRALPLTLIGQPCSEWVDCPTLQKALHNLLSSPAPMAHASAPIVAQAVGSPALLKLKESLESACRAINTSQFDVIALANNVQGPFSEISKEEKEELLKTLSGVLIEGNHRSSPLPPALLKQEFKVWPGSYPLKLKAVEKLLAPSTPAAPAPVATPAVNKISTEMQRRMIEVQTKFTSQPNENTRRTNAPASPPNFNAPTGIEFEELNWAQSNSTMLNSITTLTGILGCLHANASHTDLQTALENLLILESMGHKIPFKISGNVAALIADRPYFHLYFIHKNESPEKLVNDMNYGNKAMAGFYPASNEERTRAIQRTILELVLEGMEDAINFAQIDQIEGLVQLLEELFPKLNPKDLPPEWYIHELINRNIPPTMQVVVQARSILKEAWRL